MYMSFMTVICVHDCNLFTLSVGMFQLCFALAAVILPMLHAFLLPGPFEGLCLHTLFCVLQAAHYIGLNCNVVLCVQHLSDDAVIGNDKVRHAFCLYSQHLLRM
jgi:hypothetical protein